MARSEYSVEEAVDFSIGNEIDTLRENGYKDTGNIVIEAEAAFLRKWKGYADEYGFEISEFEAELKRRKFLE